MELPVQRLVVASLVVAVVAACGTDTRTVTQAGRWATDGEISASLYHSNCEWHRYCTALVSIRNGGDRTIALGPNDFVMLDVRAGDYRLIPQARPMAKSPPTAA